MDKISCALILILVLCMFIRYGKEVLVRVAYYAPIIVIPLIALIMTIFVVSNWSCELFSKSEILGFAGQYLAFCGAFGLGFFIHANENERRREKQLEDINYFIDQIVKSEMDYQNLRNITQNVASDEELKGCVDVITTVGNWYFYFREFERIYGKNPELKTSVGIYFRRIDEVNRLIKEGFYHKANELSQLYIRKDYYNTMPYNPSGILMEIGSAKPGLKKQKVWYKQRAIKKMIASICDNYSDIIETLIYNYMITNGVENADSCEVNVIITNQLIEGSSYINRKIKYPTEKRIVTKAIENCARYLNQNSKTHKIELVWGEYVLSDEHSDSKRQNRSKVSDAFQKVIRYII